jgi:hypothetical protein
VKNWRKMLVDIGGYDNELVGVPSGGVKEMVEEIESLREQVTLLREFVRKIKEQTPEKPDYWSSCSQCEGNSSEADDVLEQLAAILQESKA